MFQPRQMREGFNPSSAPWGTRKKRFTQRHGGHGEYGGRGIKEGLGERGTGSGDYL
jgi:hypothetical protein